MRSALCGFNFFLLDPFSVSFSFLLASFCRGLNCTNVQRVYFARALQMFLYPLLFDQASAFSLLATVRRGVVGRRW